MDCQSCRRFMLAAAHIKRLRADVIEPATSTITGFSEHIPESNPCTCFTVEKQECAVAHSSSGFIIRAPKMKPLNFLHWECQRCGVICEGEWDELLMPFTAFRMEIVNSTDVVVNMPHADDEVKLVNVTLPRHLTRDMTISSFGMPVKADRQPTEYSIGTICGSFSALLLLAGLYYKHVRSQLDSAAVLRLHNLIEIREGDFTIVMGTYKASAISFYIHRQPCNTHQVQIISDHLDAVYTLTSEGERRCTVSGRVGEEQLELEFQREERGYSVLNSRFDWPRLAYCFDHRTICAVISDPIPCR